MMRRLREAETMVLRLQEMFTSYDRATMMQPEWERALMSAEDRRPAAAVLPCPACGYSGGNLPVPQSALPPPPGLGPADTGAAASPADSAMGREPHLPSVERRRGMWAIVEEDEEEDDFSDDEQYYFDHELGEWVLDTSVRGRRS